MWAYRGESAESIEDLSRVPIQAYQVGIVSRGNGCGYRNKPGAYTLVDQFEDWLRAKMKGGGCRKYKRLS